MQYMKYIDKYNVMRYFSLFFEDKRMNPKEIKLCVEMV